MGTILEQELTRENKILVDALLAGEEFKTALDRYENTAYKGDAQKVLNEKRETWQAKMALAQPVLDSKRRKHA